MDILSTPTREQVKDVFRESFHLQTKTRLLMLPVAVYLVVGFIAFFFSNRLIFFVGLFSLLFVLLIVFLRMRKSVEQYTDYYFSFLRTGTVRKGEIVKLQTREILVTKVGRKDSRYLRVADVSWRFITAYGEEITESITEFMGSAEKKKVGDKGFVVYCEVPPNSPLNYNSNKSVWIGNDWKDNLVQPAVPD